MITYKETNRIQEKWGIDVTVQFTDTGLDTTRTFRFDNEKQIDSELASRMLKAISNIENDITKAAEPTAEEKLQSIESEITKSGSITLSKYNELAKTSVSVIAIEKEVR
jgi:hypothetical protein